MPKGHILSTLLIHTDSIDPSIYFQMNTLRHLIIHPHLLVMFERRSLKDSKNLKELF